MNKKIFVVLIPVLLIFTVYPISGTTFNNNNISLSTSNGNTLYVGGSGPNNYTKIQDAVDDALDGDTVYVYDDTSPYYENLVFNNSINLVGKDKNTTIIDANEFGDVIHISVDFVHVSGFTIQNCEDYKAGIHIRSDNNIIDNNIITLNYYGLNCINQAENNLITNNIITFNFNGIVFDNSHNNTISKNDISFNDFKGIYFGSSNNNAIVENKIDSNYLIGIHIRWESYYNIVSGNNIMNTLEQTGLVMEDSNYAFHNNFFNNPTNAKGETSIWDNGYPSGGNYWDDYKGSDRYRGPNQDKFGSDNIGDTPYEAKNFYDNYPLMKPWPRTRGDNYNLNSFFLFTKLLEQFPLLQKFLNL